MDTAHAALVAFVVQIERRYGPGSWTYNVHMLIHLVGSVLHLGPIWCVSMFKNEGYNRTILASFNGTRHYLQQIAFRLSLRRSVCKLHENVAESHPMSSVLEHGLFKHSFDNETVIKEGPKTTLKPAHEKAVLERHMCSILVAYDWIVAYGKKYGTYHNCYIF